MPVIVGIIAFIIAVLLVLLLLAYTFLSLSYFFGHPAIVTVLIAVIGAGIGLFISHGQEQGQPVRSDEDYAVLGTLRFTAEEWAARLLIVPILIVAIYGAVVAGPRARSSALSEQTRLSSLITSAVVARDISNGRPIGLGTVLRGPKTSAVVHLEYAGARPGRDTIITTLAWGRGSSSCRPWTIPNERGSYYCRWDELSNGDYQFQIAVNGERLRTLPFSVRNGSANTSERPTNVRIIESFVAEKIMAGGKAWVRSGYEYKRNDKIAYLAKYENGPARFTLSLFKIVPYQDAREVTRCKIAQVTPDANGTYYCNIKDINLEQGKHEFRLYANGNLIDTRPFSVVTKGPRSDEGERSNTCAYVASLTSYQWLEMKRTGTKPFSWSAAKQDSCLIAYSDIGGEKKECPGQSVAINVNKKIWFRAEQGTINNVCFKGLSFVRRCRECK